MLFNQAMTKVSVLGAGGKMGRGIALLLILEMVKLNIAQPESYTLHLIDIDSHGLHTLRYYLRDQITKYAERHINFLRQCYAKDPLLVSNEEIIDVFVESALDLTEFETNLDAAHDSYLIFEAIAEDVEIKTKSFLQICLKSKNIPYILSNTSSIPISVLNEKADLQNRIVGFHFYNPPAVQKLIELIIPKQTDEGLRSLSFEIAKRLQKSVVQSHDVAGFIGNGYFIREIIFALKKVQELSQEISLNEAIYTVNCLTQEWLIRPMGIFQLIDYVGLDVCHKICRVMQTYLKGESFDHQLIQSFLNVGVIGGQYPDGSQKNGIFHYEMNLPRAIYSIPDKKYQLLDSKKTNIFLGSLPEGHHSWKQLQQNPEKNQKLESYFHHLFDRHSKGAELARNFLHKSQEIAQKLVETGVAENGEDVNRVMISGFFHLYGPLNPWVPIKSGITK